MVTGIIRSSPIRLVFIHSTRNQADTICSRYMVKNDKLWLTAASAVYKFDISTDTPTCEKVYNTADIKSVCNGPDGILMLKPTEEWWAEGLVNEKGEELFKMDGAKIYKGRWMIDNTSVIRKSTISYWVRID